jgi:hypothetical protein
VDAKSNFFKHPDKVLIVHEKEMKKKYLEVCCLKQRRLTLYTIMVSTNGLRGKEAKTLLKKIMALLAKKWEKS